MPQVFIHHRQSYRTRSFYVTQLLIVLIFISAFLNFHNFSKTRENRAARDWAKTFGPIEDLPKQYPYRNDNEAAVQLKVLAVRLGIDFTVPGESWDYSPLSAHEKRFRELSENDVSLWDYLREQLGRTDEIVDPPHALLATYLNDYGKELDAVRDHILSSGPILWRQNLNWNSEYGPDPALPNMSGLDGLQTIFTARGMELAARWNYEEAEKYLEAGWKLNESLRSRCELLSQATAVAIDQKLMGLMRKLPVGTDWIQRISKHDYKKAFVKGFIVEAWFLWRMRNEERFTKSSFLNYVLDPYVRFSVSSLLEKERKDIQRIQAIDPCSLGRKDLQLIEAYESPGWNRIGTRGSLLDKNYIYGALTKINIDRELTAKIIQVRHGYFPKDGSERSITCKDGMWDYWRLPDDSTSIKYTPGLKAPYKSWPNLPTSFTVRAANSR